MCKTNYVNRVAVAEILSDVPVEKLPLVARPPPTPTSRVRPARSPGKFRCDPKGRGVELRSQGIGNRESGIEPATRDSRLPTPTPQEERFAKDHSRCRRVRPERDGHGAGGARVPCPGRQGARGS